MSGTGAAVPPPLSGPLRMAATVGRLRSHHGRFGVIVHRSSAAMAWHIGGRLSDNASHGDVHMGRDYSMGGLVPRRELPPLPEWQTARYHRGVGRE